MMKLLVSSALVFSGHALSMPRDETGLLQLPTASLLELGGTGACKTHMSKQDCAKAIAGQIASNARKCFAKNSQNEASYQSCVEQFCGEQCGKKTSGCKGLCVNHANPLFARLAASAPKPKVEDTPQPKVEDTAQPEGDDTANMNKAQLQQRSKDLQHEQASAMAELQEAQQHMVNLNDRIKAHAEQAIKSGNKAEGEAEMQKAHILSNMQEQISGHLANVQAFTTVANRQLHQSGMGLLQKKKPISFLQQKAPEDELAKEMTHDLEMNFNKIAPFGKEDTAKEL
jgi:hypothetical protein